MNPIVVREYEKIGIKGASKTDIDKNKFNKLKEFIKTNKLDEDPKFFEVYKDYIIPQNFIGSINIDNISIEIFPKIPLVKDNENHKKERFLEILEYVETFNENIYENLEIGNENMPILEFFISNFIEEVEKIVKKGLVYSYINKSENILYFKGKLDLANHIKYNIIENRFFMNFDEFSINSMENSLIKLALEKIKNISSNMENIDKLHQLLIQFEDIETSGLNPAHLFKKILFDRKNEFYRKSLNLAKFFLLDESPYSVFYNDEREVTGLFFPMEIIYESYVANKLKQLINKQISIKIQDESYRIFDKCEVGGNEEKKYTTLFKLKPDIVVEKENETIILDTKWKELKNPKENKGIYNYNISEKDIYQMITYIQVYNTKAKKCKKAYLIYPINNNDDSPLTKDIVFSGKDDLEIRAYFIDLSSEDEVDKSLKNILKDI
jgi:restriction endonuclease hincII family protein